MHDMKALKRLISVASKADNTRVSESKSAPEVNFKADTLALSYAYDIVDKSLNVVMTDKSSGEIIRKITYKHLPADLYPIEKLHGLLINQLA